MSTNQSSEIENFISVFRKTCKDEQAIIITFTCGCCYWFAHILHSRFPNSKIMYDPIANHFVTEINQCLYDITGDVTNKYDVVFWDEFDDDLEKGRINEQCILFK